MWTSLAPDFLSNLMIGPTVLPLTIESSIKMMRFPLTLVSIGPKKETDTNAIMMSSEVQIQEVR